MGQRKHRVGGRLPMQGRTESTRETDVVESGTILPISIWA
jgi:hypothetical protein